MTPGLDLGRGRSVVVRWRILAQRRLDHMIELHQTGRWKRYHKEANFREILREAHAAVAAWELLAPFDPVLDKTVEIALSQRDDDHDAMPGFHPLPDSIDAEHNLREA